MAARKRGQPRTPKNGPAGGGSQPILMPGEVEGRQPISRDQMSESERKRYDELMRKTSRGRRQGSS